MLTGALVLEHENCNMPSLTPSHRPLTQSLYGGERFVEKAETTMTKTILAAAFLIAISISATGYPASFDCKKAKTAVEKMICGEPRK